MDRGGIINDLRMKANRFWNLERSLSRRSFCFLNNYFPQYFSLAFSALFSIIPSILHHPIPMIIEGRTLAARIQERIHAEIKQSNIKPTLAVLLVGENPASLAYIRQKRKAADLAGMGFVFEQFTEQTTEKEILDLLAQWATNEQIHGIIVQLPLPAHVSVQKIIDAIPVEKDVDGFTSGSIAGLFLGNPDTFVPCTPKGVIALLEDQKIEVRGKRICIIGKGNVVGKPMALLLANQGATVTTCDVFTRNLAEITLISDIIISATGVPCLIKGSMVRPGSFVVDVGFSLLDSKAVGDCDTASIQSIAQITPVPGGVGPLTVAALLENTLLAYKKQQK
jgi:methylenetetrahydrofolate dehydrogenase (NADP+)/methenyltetrahydrofolate cyclohydrolase